MVFDTHVHLIKLHILRDDIKMSMSSYRSKFTFDPVKIETKVLIFCMHVYLIKLHILIDTVTNTVKVVFQGKMSNSKSFLTNVDRDLIRGIHVYLYEAAHI